MALKHNPFESARRVEPPRSSPRDREVTRLRVFDDPLPTVADNETRSIVGEQFPNNKNEKATLDSGWGTVGQQLGNCSPIVATDSPTVPQQTIESLGTNSPTSAPTK